MVSLRNVEESAQALLEITVIDQGIGVSASEVDHVFDLFWQSSQNNYLRLNHSGQGIGLYISK